MTIKDIITIPDPILRENCQPIEEVTSDLTTLMDDMLETMYAAPGIGLAAPQIALPLRLIVMDDANKEEGDAPNPIIMINPEIVETSDELSSYEEGCLSIPEYFAEIERPAWVRVAYRDREGHPQELKCEGLLATIAQHEIDHLDGILFVDHLSTLKRNMIIRKLTKQKRQRAID